MGKGLTAATALVAAELGRKAVGIDISEKYVEQAAARCKGAA